MLYNKRIQKILENIDIGQSKIFPNQHQAAKEIILSFTAHEHPDDETTARNRHVFLIAEMQSGKTGVTTETARLLKIDELKRYFNIDSYYFITGMNANGLYVQTRDRIQEHIGLDTDVYVFKNSDLELDNKPKQNSIIFIDESHYGSKEKDRVTKWIQSWDNDKEGFLKENNRYIVSVSATPFEELNSDGADVKQQIILKNDNNYIGISDFLQNDQVFQAENTEKDIILRIEEAYDRMSEDKKGIIFIRTNKNQVKNNISLRDRFNVVELDTSNNKQIDFTQIDLRFEAMLSGRNEKYNKPIIFFIKEAMRAGQTLDEEIKDYTYLVYDYTSNLPETTAQGLLGRICGYRKTDNWKKTLFFVNKLHAEQYNEWKQQGFPKIGIPPKRINKEPKNGLISERNGDYITLELTQQELSKISGRNSTAAWRVFNEILERREVQYDYIGEVYIGNYDENGTVYSKWIKPKDGINAFRAQSSMFKEINNRSQFIVDEDENKTFIHIVKNGDKFVLQPGILKKPNRKTSRAVKPHLDTI